MPKKPENKLPERRCKHEMHFQSTKMSAFPAIVNKMLKSNADFTALEFKINFFSLLCLFLYLEESKKPADMTG